MCCFLYFGQGENIDHIIPMLCRAKMLVKAYKLPHTISPNGLNPVQYRIQAVLSLFNAGMIKVRRNSRSQDQPRTATLSIAVCCSSARKSRAS